MPHDHTDDCERLQEALADARSRLVPPQRESAMPGFQAPVVTGTGDTEPSGSPDLEAQIQTLEQQLRDLGCEPR